MIWIFSIRVRGVKSLSIDIICLIRYILLLKCLAIWEEKEASGLPT